jgi:hypothetical protein
MQNIGIYDGKNWDTLQGGINSLVVAATVNSQTNDIYVVCVSTTTGELRVYKPTSASTATTHSNSQRLDPLIFD